MLPFEFTIDGPPVSQQARRRERLREWKQAVRNAAQARWPINAPPYKISVTLTIVYFYDTIDFDVDNIPKPISDALNRLVYADDNQITDCIVRKRALNSSFILPNASSLLIERVNQGKEHSSEFLYVLIDTAYVGEVTGVQFTKKRADAAAESAGSSISKTGL